MSNGRTGQRPFSAGEKIAFAFAVLVVGLVSLQSCGDDGSNSDDGRGKTAAAPSLTARVEPPAGGSHMQAVMASRFTEWPFTVSAGTLRCRSGSEVTFEAPDGTEYAVNGTAKGAGYPSIEPIWADDEDLGNGLKVDISEVLAKGTSLC